MPNQQSGSSGQNGGRRSETQSSGTPPKQGEQNPGGAQHATAAGTSQAYSAYAAQAAQVAEETRERAQRAAEDRSAGAQTAGGQRGEQPQAGANTGEGVVDKATGALSQAKDKAGDVLGQAAGKAQDVLGQAAGVAQSAASQAAGAAQSVAGQATGGAQSQGAGSAQSAAGQPLSAVAGTAQELAGQVQDTAYSASSGLLGRLESMSSQQYTYAVAGSLGTTLLLLLLGRRSLASFIGLWTAIVLNLGLYRRIARDTAHSRGGQRPGAW